MRTALPLLASFMLAGAAFASEGSGPSAEVAALALRSADISARGGLALYLGPSDAKGLTTLAAGCRLYVQGVVADRDRAERLRMEIGKGEFADRASVVWRRTQHLPYLDNLANLIVAEGWGQGDLKGLALSEVVRVLCPNGVAVVGSDAGLDAAALLAEVGKVPLAKAEKLSRPGAWIRISKQLNPDFGEWTSFAGGPEMNLVSTDRVVSPGKEVRWHNGPVWSTATFGNTVLAGGRSFHTEVDFIRPDENGYGKGQLVLVARDAFNGCDLWREQIKPSGAAAPATRFCADDKRVYHLDGKELVARDAATGKIVKNYGPDPATVTSLGDCLIMGGRAVDKETGNILWSRPAACHSAGKEGVVYVLGKDSVEAVSLADGKSLWKTALKELVASAGNARIMCKADAVYVVQQFRDKNQKMRQDVIAIDRGSGAVRWSDVRDMVDAVLPFADQVCFTAKVKSDKPDINVLENILLDAKTGKQVKTSRTPSSQHIGTRCWGPRATDRFVIYEGRFYVDTQAFALAMREGIRSSCGIGQFPAYGLEYNTPHACSCEVALRGVAALSPGSAMPRGEVSPALFKGPGGAAGAPARPRDWPMYRASTSRSDSSGAELPAGLKPLWAAKLGARALPQATGAGNLVFVADTDAHRVVTLDLETGKTQWTFPTEGRVSMAPSYHQGLCLFGDHAGWVYCVEAAGGKLVWQLQAAPEQRYMAAFNQFASSWPVKSGVLVVNGSACFVAGNGSTMDGGLYAYGVDAAGGQVRWKRNFIDIRPTDLLVSDGRTLYLGTLALNPADGTDQKGSGAAPQERVLKSGPDCHGDISILDMLAASLDHGQTRDIKRLPNDGRAEGHMIAFDKDRSITAWRYRRVSGHDKDFVREDNGHCHVMSNSGKEWVNKGTGRQMQAILLAGPRVYCAGIPEFGDTPDKPALFVLSSTDGKELQRILLDAAPSIDGLSAVGGKLILTTADGQVMCYGGK